MLRRKGFTTGSACAAGAKAAALSLLHDEHPKNVTITLPNASDLQIPIQNVYKQNGQTIASVIKDAGDDPDVTNGLEIITVISINDKSQEIEITGGLGVGIVTKAGLQIEQGKHAINPVPQKMIKTALRNLSPNTGFNVEITVPDGKKAAAHTFNSRLGIIDGISILGTTGIVEPMSLDAIKATIKCEIDVIYEQNHETLFLAPGKIGESALTNAFGNIAAAQTSNFIGYALNYAKHKGFKNITFGGHPGKLAKILMGYLDTHSKKSPQAVQFVADYLGLKNNNFNTVEDIIKNGCNYDTILKHNFNDMAEDIAKKLIRLFGFDKVEVYLFDMEKRIVGIGQGKRREKEREEKERE
ncbi:cobalamin biosynthesis protein CbiD [Candidatus Magnetoovum chiemensis]|nr:cobalamin biosynthesis protein CbiD [Candidatus Magnetoovum chiemensis]